MTTTDLQAGIKLNDEIRELDRVKEYFKRALREDETETERIVEFLTKCQNLGSGELKKVMADQASSHLWAWVTEQLRIKQSEFEALGK